MTIRTWEQYQNAERQAIAEMRKAWRTQAERKPWIQHLASERKARQDMRRQWLAEITPHFETIADICKGVGIKRPTLTSMAIKGDFNLPQLEGKPKVSDRAIRDLAAQGLTRKQAAERLGCHYNTIAERAKSAGIRFCNDDGSKPGPKPAPKLTANPLSLMAQYAARENAAMRRGWQS